MSVIRDLENLVGGLKNTILIGDLNICFENERNHIIFREIERIGFSQKIKNPTHEKGGIIDHVFFFSHDNYLQSLDVGQSGQFFTDHDLLIFSEGTEIIYKIQN